MTLSLLPHPFRPSAAVHPQHLTRLEVQEIIERITERLYHPSARTQTLADARPDLLAMLAEIEAAVDEVGQ